MTPIRFHLDEHVDDAIAKGLRRRGLDVTTTDKAGLCGAKDVEHVRYALAESRVVVTLDDDFAKLHRCGVAHAGIVYGHQHARTIGQIVDFLVTLHGCYTAEEMRDRFEYL